MTSVRFYGGFKEVAIFGLFSIWYIWEYKDEPSNQKDMEEFLGDSI